MTDEKHVAPGDERLWRLARAASTETGVDRGTEGPSLDAEEVLLLAAYLDGDLDAEAEAEVEAWLAGDTAACEALIAARQALAEGPSEAAPLAIVERASALVRRPPAPERRSWLAGLFGPGAGLLRPAGMAAAAAVAVAGLAGFQLGKVGAEEVLQVQRIIAQEASLGLRGDDLF